MNIQNGAQNAVRFDILPVSFFGATSDEEKIEGGVVAAQGKAKGQGWAAVSSALMTWAHCAQVGGSWGNDGCFPGEVSSSSALAEWLGRLAEDATKGWVSESWEVNAHVFTSGAVTILRWDGIATRGRYLEVVVNRTTLEVTMEWDTATGRESDFMMLPSGVVNDPKFSMVEVIRDIHIEEDRSSPFAQLANY